MKIFILLSIILTNKADDCCDGQISSILLRRHAASCLYLHCDVLIGRDTVGLSQLQHCGYSWIVSAHTHHPTTIIEGLKAAGGGGMSLLTSLIMIIFSFKQLRKDHLGDWTLVHLLAGLVVSNAVPTCLGFFMEQMTCTLSGCCMKVDRKAASSSS